MAATDIYSFKPLDKTGEPFPLDELKGKVVLVVNTASKCGFTPQFDGLEKLSHYWEPVREVIYFKRPVYAQALTELAERAFPEGQPPLPPWWAEVTRLERGAASETALPTG